MPNLWIYAFDIVAIAVLSYGLYFRRHRRRDMPLAFVALNVGVLTLATVLSTVSVGTGLGLGLFGVLSLIRLRSSEIAQEEVAYYFVSLALGLITGFQPTPLWIAPVLGSLLVAVMYVADHPKLLVRDRRQIVTLDAAYTDEVQLTQRLEDLLGATVTHLIVNEVDLVRDMTEVDVRFRIRPAGEALREPAPARRLVESRPVSVMTSVPEALAPLSLEEVLAVADLQTRTDRKYVVDPEVFAALVDELGAGLGVLEIGGVRSFRYESVYFDTPALDSYLGAAHGRRRRFKVRTRSYLDSGDCMLEVKTRGGRGETVKDRMPYDIGRRSTIDAAGLEFVRSHASLPAGATLAPVLTTAYARSTLVDLATGSRLTCDTGSGVLVARRRLGVARRRAAPGDEVRRRPDRRRPLPLAGRRPAGGGQQVLRRHGRPRPLPAGQQVEPHPPPALRPDSGRAVRVLPGSWALLMV